MTNPFARIPLRARRARGADLTEIAAGALIIVALVIGAASRLGGQSATTFRTVAEQQSARDLPGGPEPVEGVEGQPLIARWVFMPGCNDWSNMLWNGSGCVPSSNPGSESPLQFSPAGVPMAVWVQYTPENSNRLELELIEYAGSSELERTSVGSLVLGEDFTERVITLSSSGELLRVVIAGPAELRTVEIWFVGQS